MSDRRKTKVGRTRGVAQIAGTAALAALVIGVLFAMPAGAAPVSGNNAASNAVRPPAGNNVVHATSASTEALFSENSAVPAMIQVTGAPAALAAMSAARHGASPAQAGRGQKLQNDHVQQAVLAQIGSAKIDAQVLYRVQSAYNGIAVSANGKALRQISALPGVVAVHRIALMKVNNANTQPLIGAPQAWESYGKTGTGIKIGIIDTGIDYTHTMFGGAGTTQALTDARSAANNVELAGPGSVPPGYTVSSNGSQIFPSAKVVGGFDFAGDNYDAATAGKTTPHPDANPEDCPSSLGGGHGSHVSGTAAGYGVNSDGSTYTGPWNTTTPFDTMRIGPGVAPQAQLYSLRVFGCTGSTALTTQAIDWAVDPNGDGNPADHLDVINLSLGSASGTPDDPSAVSMDNATQVGVLAAVSAGNNNDVFYVSGSPGSATGALTVASSVDTTDVVDAFQVNSPAGFEGQKVATFSVNFNWAASAPLTADLVYNVSGNTTACSAFPAGSLTGKVVLVDWAPAGTSNFPCGSTARANNAQNAGAVGIIMASGQTFFDTSISGNAGIRGVFTTNTVGNQLKSALAAGTTSITFSNAFQGTLKFIVPGADDTVSTFSSRGPRNRDNGLKPDIAAPGQSIFSTDAGSLNRGRTLSGTSMAAPHMAGTLALLKQANPTWSVPEIKALAMNTAAHDLWTGLNQSGSRYGPARVGSGRVDIPQALASSVVAYNAAIPRAVSVSFGAVEVPGSLVVDKTIKVVNKGASDATYDVSYDAITSIPGVTYSFPDGNAVSVPAGGETTFRVRLSADASLMKNTHDPTIALTQSGNPRQWLSEASGNVKLTPASGPVLRVPVYAAARPASQMTTTQSTLSFAGSTGSTNLGLTGTGVSTGAIGPNEHNSLVTPFELQGVSPQLSSAPAGMSPSALNADLRYIGATASPTQVFFGLTTWRDFNTLATDQQFSIYIDRNRDGVDDLQLFATRFTDSDVFVTALATLPSTSGSVQGFTNILSANTPTAAMNNNIAILPVNRASLGMPAGSTRFNYRVEVSSRFNGLVDKFPSSGYMTFDFANRGFDFSGGSSSPPVYVDMPGNGVPVAYNQTNYLANNSLGTLLLHHYNTQGTRAQVIPVAATISITAPASKTYGDDPFTVSATASTGQSVSFGSQTPNVCSVSGTTVTILAAGTCTVRGSTPATANFAAAYADSDITIDKASSTTTVTCPSSVTYDGSAQTPCSASVTGAGGLSQSLSVDYTNNTDAGTAGASATYAGDSNHNGSSDSTTFTIDKADQTINVTTAAPASAAYNSGFSVDANAPGGAVSYSSSGVCTNTGSSFTMTSGTGTCTVLFDQSGDANYNAAPQVSESVTATKLDQSITFAAIPSHTYGDADFDPGATSSSGYAVSYLASGNCSIVGGLVHITGAGSCTVTAMQAGDADYNAAPQKQRSFSIAKAAQSIVITQHAPASATYGQHFTVLATGGGSGNPVSYGSSGVCSNSGPHFTITGVGTCTVTYNQAGSADYNAAPQKTEATTVKVKHLNAGSTSCNGTYNGTGATVVVRAGDTCALIPGTHVTSNVSVRPGGTLFVRGVKISGNLTSLGTATACGSRIGRDVVASGGSLQLGGPDCSTGNKIAGDVNVTDDANNVWVWDNTITGGLTVKNITGPSSSIHYNVVGGNLLVAQSGPPVDITGNHANNAHCTGNTGQTGSANQAAHTNTCPA